MSDIPPKRSDLGVRTLSAIVMLAVAGTALWLGGWWWTVFVAAVALGVMWEWRGLTVSFRHRTAWNLAGLVFVFIAASVLWRLRIDFGAAVAALPIVLVAAIDIGAYFAGRTIGGPKIAPRISPSKTWAGLLGGVFVATAVVWAAVKIAVDRGAVNSVTFVWIGSEGHAKNLAGSLNLSSVFAYLCIGALIAIIAQAGDFFESWMKRRAGVKDSGKLIPGHGGLFDRVDGLLAVLFVMGIATLATRGVG